MTRWLFLLLLVAAPAQALVRNAATNSSVTITTASAQVLAADSLRGYLLISNPNATNTFWCNIPGGTAAANASGNVFFGANAALIFDASVPTNAINCIGSGSGTVVNVTTITNVSN